jgi:putative lipoprotein
MATSAASPLCRADGPASSPAAQPAPSDPDPWFGRDKLYHFGATALISAGGYGVGKLAFGGYAAPAIFGSSLALAAGATKELLDMAGFGDPSWRDITWDVIGTAVGTGLCLSIDALVHRGSSSAAAPTVTVTPAPGAKGIVLTFPLSL